MCNCWRSSVHLLLARLQFQTRLLRQQCFQRCASSLPCIPRACSTTRNSNVLSANCCTCRVYPNVFPLIRWALPTDMASLSIWVASCACPKANLQTQLDVQDVSRYTCCNVSPSTPTETNFTFLLSLRPLPPIQCRGVLFDYFLHDVPCRHSQDSTLINGGRGEAKIFGGLSDGRCSNIVFPLQVLR